MGNEKEKKHKLFFHIFWLWRKVKEEHPSYGDRKPEAKEVYNLQVLEEEIEEEAEEVPTWCWFSQLKKKKDKVKFLEWEMRC